MRLVIPSRRCLSHAPNVEDQKLRNDVKKLGSILGNYIKDHDPKVFEAVEKLRRLGREVLWIYN
jgi:phosphoenolpyruvate carboxylase